MDEKEKDLTPEQYAKIQIIIREMLASGFGVITIRIQNGHPVIVERVDSVRI